MSFFLVRTETRIRNGNKYGEAANFQKMQMKFYLLQVEMDKTCKKVPLILSKLKGLHADTTVDGDTLVSAR